MKKLIQKPDFETFAIGEIDPSNVYGVKIQGDGAEAKVLFLHDSRFYYQLCRSGHLNKTNLSSIKQIITESIAEDPSCEFFEFKNFKEAVNWMLN